jgi:hypothetical protein
VRKRSLLMISVSRNDRTAARAGASCAFTEVRTEAQERNGNRAEQGKRRLPTSAERKEGPSWHGQIHSGTTIVALATSAWSKQCFQQRLYTLRACTSRGTCRRPASSQNARVRLTPSADDDVVRGGAHAPKLPRYGIVFARPTPLTPSSPAKSS